MYFPYSYRYNRVIPLLDAVASLQADLLLSQYVHDVAAKIERYIRFRGNTERIAILLHVDDHKSDSVQYDVR